MKLHRRTDAEPWSEARNLAAPAGAPPDAQRAFTRAGEEFRLVLLKDGKFWEQRYNFSGEPNGGPAELPKPVISNPGANAWIYQSIILTAMVVIVLVILYKRRGNSTPSTDE